VSLPTPDAQSSGPLSQQPRSTSTPTPHSKPTSPLYPPRPSTPSTPPAFIPTTEAPNRIVRTDSSQSARSSWDLPDDGLKTLTAKRELLPRPERRPASMPPGMATAPRSYVFILVILVCIIVMLISGGIVFFLILQP
jgi:hypothetical protein